MPDLLETLRKLQAIDAELFRLRNEQRLKPLVLEEAKQLMAEQDAKGHAIEARLKASHLQQKEKEIELSTREANVKKLQAQLFQVKTNKEYAAIQHEIDQSKADASLLEEEILALLDVIDRTKREHEAQLGVVKERQDALRVDEARVAQDLAAIGEQLGTFEQQRSALTPLVEPTALSTYERVLAAREGLALVPLMNESCGGCHMVQPPQVINEARLKARLVMCNSCNRILYFDENGPAH